MCFLVSCNYYSLAHEIKWLDAYEREHLGQMLLELERVIGNVHGTLVEFRRPYKYPNHSRWFNGRKMMYSINNMVIVNNHNLINLC